MTYNDNDFVYVDPKNREVKGLVQWMKFGTPKPLLMEMDDGGVNGEPGKKKIRQKRRHYPWGTYRTMKRMYRLEGKEKEIEQYKALDDALKKALKEPF